MDSGTGGYERALPARDRVERSLDAPPVEVELVREPERQGGRRLSRAFGQRLRGREGYGCLWAERSGPEQRPEESAALHAALELGRRR